VNGPSIAANIVLYHFRKPEDMLYAPACYTGRRHTSVRETFLWDNDDLPAGESHA